MATASSRLLGSLLLLLFPLHAARDSIRTAEAAPIGQCIDRTYGDAFSPVHFNAQQDHLVHQSVEGAQRVHPLAEGPVKHHL